MDDDFEAIVSQLRSAIAAERDANNALLTALQAGLSEGRALEVLTQGVIDAHSAKMSLLERIGRD